MATTAQVERRTERPPALDARTACEAFQITARAMGDAPALRTRGDQVVYTWREYDRRVREIAAGLAGLGLERGRTIALMMSNRPEFHLIDAAAMHLGATPHSIYNTCSPEQIAYQVRDADSHVIACERAFEPRIREALRELPMVEHVIVVDEPTPEGCLSLEEVAARAPSGFDFEATWRSVGEDDVLTLIYTSGTTGPPKGVELTHGNLCAGARSYDAVLKFPLGGRVVSYLPMAHIAERAVSHYLPMLCGFSATSCPDPREVVAYLPEVRPSWFFAPPRVWEKLQAGLQAMVANLPEDRRRPLERALEVGLRRTRAEQAAFRGEGPGPDERLLAEWREVDEQVLAGARAMLGMNELVMCNVGAAPCPPEVIEFFHALGIPLAELWGMSETAGAGTCNPPERIKIGTVGPPLPGAEIKLASDGEILIRAPFVMRGYRNKPDKTREAFTDDGFLRTGDVGEFDDDGYLRIVDRKKELIINAAGKNMSPANIEARLKTAGPLIGQAAVIGDRRPYNVALLTLDPDGLQAFAHEHQLDVSDPAQLARHPLVIQQVRREVALANERLARVEQIKRFALLAEQWEPGGDELTPTMKLKRKPIEQKYAKIIEELYSGGGEEPAPVSESAESVSR